MSNAATVSSVRLLAMRAAQPLFLGRALGPNQRHHADAGLEGRTGRVPAAETPAGPSVRGSRGRRC